MISKPGLIRLKPVNRDQNVGLYGAEHVKSVTPGKKQDQSIQINVNFFSFSCNWFYEICVILTSLLKYYSLIPDYWNYLLQYYSCKMYCIHTISFVSLHVVIHKLGSHFPSSQRRYTGIQVCRSLQVFRWRSQSETRPEKSGFVSAPSGEHGYCT